MSKDKNKRDLISEQEFNHQMEENLDDPLEDSPGDSEDDAGLEFMAGLNYSPGEKNELAESDDEEAEESEDVIYADDSSNSPSESPSDSKQHLTTPRGGRLSDLEPSASGQPSPRADLDTASDLH